MIYLRHMTRAERQKLVSKTVTFRPRWSDAVRTQTITRIGDRTVICTAYVYHFDDMCELREATP